MVSVVHPTDDCGDEIKKSHDPGEYHSVAPPARVSKRWPEPVHPAGVIPTSGENTIGTHTADRLMCHVLGVSPSGYYAWRSRPESARTVANRRLLAVVRRLHAQHRGRYGSPRIHAALRAEGDTVSCGWIERLMRRTAFAASLPAGSVP